MRIPSLAALRQLLAIEALDEEVERELTTLRQALAVTSFSRTNSLKNSGNEATA